MNPKRIAASISLLNYTLRDQDEFALIAPNTVDPSVLEIAHSVEYIETMKKLSNPETNSSSELRDKGIADYGIGTSDCPVFDHMAEVAELIVGSTLKAGEEIMKGTFSKTFVMLAGLHHASRERASGFCYYNDINVTIHRLKKLHPGTKILYVDTDLHAGDGVNYEFFRDPEVLTFSIHESGKYLFPGNCFSNEVGLKEGEGYAINFPTFPFTYDELYVELLENYLPPITESYNPDLIIWQAGVDGHADDPLGHLMLTTETYSKLGLLIAKLGEQMDTPKVLSLGGGGYNPISVAKSWFAEINSLAGVDQLKVAPNEWIDKCRNELDIEMPKNLLDEPIQMHKKEKDEILDETEDLKAEFEKNLSPYWSF